jgi:hypothetical protein
LVRILQLRHFELHFETGSTVSSVVLAARVTLLEKKEAPGLFRSR